MLSNRIALVFASALLLSAGCQAGTHQSTTIGGTTIGAGPETATAKSPATSPESPNWVHFTDSAEGAFSMDVPYGWQVLGGMYRFGYFDVRWMMNARSLDGKVAIRLDDPNVPPYVLPGPHSGPAGHAAIRPNMFQMIVDNYRDAGSYANMYAKRRFESVCSSLNPRASDWTPAMPSGWEVAPGSRTSQAAIAFDCATSDGPRVVIVYARTTIVGTDGLWVADPVISIAAAPERLREAEAMSQHMIESWKESPEWKTYQDRMTQVGLGQMAGEFRTFMGQMQAYHQQREAAMNQQVAGFEARMHSQADQVSSWGNILTGLTNVSDPATGQTFQVFSGPKSNYYMNGQGVKINSDFSPGAGFHQLTDVGP